MTVMRIAAAAAHFGRDVERSIERIGMIVTAARRMNATLLVLPDAAIGGYLEGLDDVPGAGPASLPPALHPDGPELERVRRLVGPMVVCLGYSEADTAGDTPGDTGAGRRWNSAVCLTGDGVLGRYRKVHQPPAEAACYAGGAELEAFDTPVGRLGMLIDYDKTFPEAARTLALDDARIIACLSAWPASLTQRAPRLTQDRQSRLFDLYDCARAAENQVVWVSANQTGRMGSLRFLGQSKVVGPGGEVLARTWGKAGLAVAEVDVDAEVDRARLVLHHLSERRPDLYREK